MKEKLLIWLGNTITKLRYVFLALFIGLFVIGFINLNNVKINESLTDYLPSKTETKEGLKLMEKEYGTLISIDVMLDNVSQKDALKYYEKLKEIKGIDSVLFSLNDSYYKDNKALYKVELIGKDKHDAKKIAKEIKKVTKDKDTYIYSDEFEDPTDGVTLVLILCIFIIFVVLLTTAKTYFEPVIAFFIFLISIVLNMGSNFIFNEISYITKAIAVVLQLALSIDYVIIVMNQYMKEIDDTDDKILAIKKTLSKSISEIFASSLTTVAGLIALVFMQLRIGGDIGIVLSKGILCSLLTVILIMPVLLDIFKTPIVKFKKKEKKNTNSILKVFANFIAKYKFALLPIYVVLIIISICFIPFYNYVYDLNTIKSVRTSENIKALYKQQDTFGKDNTLVIIFENKEKDYNKELLFADSLNDIKGVKSVTSIGSYKLSENIALGTKIKYPYVALLLNMDSEMVKGLYQLYIMKNVDAYQEVDVENYGITVIDLFTFIYDNQAILPLTDENKLLVKTYYTKLNESINFLESEEYTRVVLTLNTDIESEETDKLIKKIRNKTNEYYDNALFVGNSINARDLKSTFTNDNLIITFVTILFIALILLITFRSFGMALLLILTIEGSILVNFALVTLTGHKIFFMSYIVVSAIQMGATIDYAIVIASRYMQLRKKKNKEEAIIGTLHDRLSAIITSGLILLSAGFLVGTITTSSVISSIGLFLGLGTLISLLATMLFLPAILYTFDTFIQKTTIKGK